jgi:hypothetical protein
MPHRHWSHDALEWFTCAPSKDLDLSATLWTHLFGMLIWYFEDLSAPEVGLLYGISSIVQHAFARLFIGNSMFGR